jgi:hypothetical protein
MKVFGLLVALSIIQSATAVLGNGHKNPKNGSSSAVDHVSPGQPVYGDSSTAAANENLQTCLDDDGLTQLIENLKTCKDEDDITQLIKTFVHTGNKRSRQDEDSSTGAANENFQTCTDSCSLSMQNLKKLVSGGRDVQLSVMLCQIKECMDKLNGDLRDRKLRQEIGKSLGHSNRMLKLKFGVPGSNSPE